MYIQLGYSESVMSEVKAPEQNTLHYKAKSSSHTSSFQDSENFDKNNVIYSEISTTRHGIEGTGV